jgi:hypothetical protein
MRDHVVVLASPDATDYFLGLIRRVGPSIRTDIAYTTEDLDRAALGLGENSLLLSFATSVIVPARILERIPGGAVNFHAAPPEYPGRDPHHFARYDNARRYGATAHLMTSKVDDGPILATEYVDLPLDARPAEILALGNAAAHRLIDEIVPRLLRGDNISPLNVSWSGRKKTRAEFRALCDLPHYIEKNELLKRLGAVEFEGYNNPFIDLHGIRFRMEGNVPESERAVIVQKWGGFTEAAYANILDLARTQYRFSTLTEDAVGKHVLWFHDVDMSVHRATRLAEIEHEKGLVSTFFLMLGSAFYDLADPEVLSRARRIVSLGHRIGLHSDLGWNRQIAGTPERFAGALVAERARLAALTETSVDAVSFRTSDTVAFPEDDTVAGMINVSSRSYRERYAYCSDANGCWNVSSVPDVLASGGHERLQVLTHPQWWTPEPLSPRARVERCVAGRAAYAMRQYDELSGRSE